MKHSMNIDVLRRARNSILANPEQHDQGRYANACGTPSCAAGFICFNELPSGEYHVLLNFQKQSGGPHVFNTAKKLAGLTQLQADCLFLSGASYRPTIDSARRTAAVIDNLIETGNVDWSVQPVSRSEFNLAEYSERFIEELRNMPITDRQILRQRGKKK